LFWSQKVNFVNLVQRQFLNVVAQQQSYARFTPLKALKGQLSPVAAENRSGLESSSALRPHHNPLQGTGHNSNLSSLGTARQMDRNTGRHDEMGPNRFEGIELAFLICHDVTRNPVSVDKFDVPWPQYSRAIRRQSQIAQPRERPLLARQTRLAKLHLAGVFVPSGDRLSFDMGAIGKHGQVARSVVAPDRRGDQKANGNSEK
jgi:hypothetical protein